MATKNEHDENQAEFEKHFNTDEPQKPAMSDDEAFGLGPEGGGDAGAADDTGAAAGDPPAADAAAADAGAAADAPAAAAPSDDAKRLADKEQELNAREAELDQRAAAIATTNTDETQTGSEDVDGKGGDAGDGDGDPRAALTEDFGPEFVANLEAFIKQVAGGSVTDGIGTLQATVQNVIDELQNERNQNHFKAIAAAHEDFMDIVDTPQFKDWIEDQPEADKAELQRVTDSGSAKEIIDMLTKFKASKDTDAGGASADELDAAEGVRSSGIQLPKPPKDSADYASAWDAA